MKTFYIVIPGRKIFNTDALINRLYGFRYDKIDSAKETAAALSREYKSPFIVLKAVCIVDTKIEVINTKD